MRLTLVAIVIALSALVASEMVQWLAERRLGNVE